MKKQEKVRLMIVDDRSQIRDELKTFLELSGEIEVIVDAADGAEAIRLAQALTPDVIVMDIQMPGVDGLEATRKIKSGPTNPAIIILTIHTEEAMRHLAFEAGADDYVEKNAGVNRLLEAIQRVISKKQEEEI